MKTSYDESTCMKAKGPCRHEIAAAACGLAMTTKLRKLTLMLFIAASLSGCADAAFGPVDHECHGSPFRSHGSGCSGHGGVTHPIIVAFSASDRPTNDAVYPTSQLACCRLSLK